MILKPSHWMVQQATGQVRLCFDGISMISGFIIHMVLLCFIKKTIIYTNYIVRPLFLFDTHTRLVWPCSLS